MNALTTNPRNIVLVHKPMTAPKPAITVRVIDLDSKSLWGYIATKDHPAEEMDASVTYETLLQRTKWTTSQNPTVFENASNGIHSGPYKFGTSTGIEYYTGLNKEEIKSLLDFSRE